MTLDAARDTGGSDTPPVEAGPDAMPINGLPTETWAWVPFPDARCRDGSSTGIGVNLNPASTKLMIFLAGGGECVDVTSCSMNPASFGEADFTGLSESNSDGSVNVGVFDRTNAANPVQQWSYVYVPYCTGDSHSGNNVSTVSGVGPQQFVGYVNVGLYLARIVPTFPNLTQVLIAGVSAGGGGAALNYLRTARAFGSVPVDLLDDSAPPLEAPYVNPSAQIDTTALWGLDGTVVADCGSHCSSGTMFGLDYATYAASSHPNATFGLVDSANDQNFAGNPMFEAGLLDIRAKLASYSNCGAFIFTGSDHTSLQKAAFYARTAATLDGGASVLLTDWVRSLVDGTAVNVGP